MHDIIQNCCVAICFGTTANIHSNNDLSMSCSFAIFGYILSSIRCDIRDIRRK